MQRAQDFDRLFRIGHRRVHQAGLEGADLPPGVARAAVPGGRHHALVVLDAPVPDAYPVAQHAARRGDGADALGFLRPGRRVPLLDVGGGRVAGLDVGDQFLVVVEHHFGAVLRFERARQRAADGRRQQLPGGVAGFRHAERLREVAVDDAGRAFDLFLHALAVLVALERMRIAEDVARQRADFHRMAAPARRLDP